MSDLLRFDGFELDLRSRKLRKAGRAVSLQEQPFRILEMLVKATGEVVAREELISALWPAGTFVDFDRGLNSAVNKLRAALGDSADEPRFIETMGRRGYRFIGAQRPTSTRRIILPATVALLLGSVGLLLHFQKKPQTAIHSIAVLPLANLSSDRQQEFF